MISTSLMIRCAQQHTDMSQDFEDFKKDQMDHNDDVTETLYRQEGDIQDTQHRLEDVEGRLDRQDRNLRRKVRRLEMKMIPATDHQQYLKQEVDNAGVDVIDWDLANVLFASGRFKSVKAIKQVATRCGIKYHGF